MNLVRWRVEFFCIITSVPIFLACVSSDLTFEKKNNPKVVLSLSSLQTGLRGDVVLQQNSNDQMDWADKVGSQGSNLFSELHMLGVSRIEPVDAGFSGKLGQSIIFAAEKRLIPNYDRLYWVMIRVLSEKYGCFIRKKIDRGELVAFKCRDQRIVTFRRRMTGQYAVFKARQYRSDGREIVMLNKQAKAVSAARVVAKQP